MTYQKQKDEQEVGNDTSKYYLQGNVYVALTRQLKEELVANLVFKRGEIMSKENDPINPNHYKNHPSGIECIQITRHMNFNIGNAIKYLWRAGSKNSVVEDLRKAAWYINDEIEKIVGKTEPLSSILNVASRRSAATTSSPMPCSHANEVPYRCDCQKNCYCWKEGQCKDERCPDCRRRFINCICPSSVNRK